MRAVARFVTRAILLALALAVPAIVRAQGFQSVFSQDGNDVWAVGDAGVVYRSFDGGVNWTTFNLGNKTLRGVVARGFNVIVVGDSGKIWRSQNSGGSWALSVMSGAPQLRAVQMPSNLVAFAVGAGGVVFRSLDGGGSWGARPSGTASGLNAMRCLDDNNAWAVGDNGVAIVTLDGGTSFSPIALGTTNTLLSVDVDFPTIWVVGAEGTARVSTDGGGIWNPVRLKLDARADVRSVELQSPSTVFLAGGGGFIWRSLDGGATWQFPIHPMHAAMSAIAFAGNKGWAANKLNRVVLRSADLGATWSMPSGATGPTRTWSGALLDFPFVGDVRGSTINLSPVWKTTMYCALGESTYVSRDEGETWRSQHIFSGGAYRVNAFIVSPKDTNLMVAAVASPGGSPDRVLRTTNGGTSWTTVMTHDFGEYGTPLEIDPDHPDTLYFGGDSDHLYRSVNFGLNWSVWSANGFNSPCDIQVVPDSSNVILIGDGVTDIGQPDYDKSSDGGVTWAVKTTRPIGASEIPAIAVSRLRPATAFGTNWGDGGVQRSTDYGDTWPNVSAISQAWGVDVCREDPNLVIFGVYGGGKTYLSIDGGSSFTSNNLTGSNYSFYVRDRATILAQNSGGIYKMRFSYAYTPVSTQAVTVIAPNGGEVWEGGTVQNITWSAQNVAIAHIEYRKTLADPWQTVADVSGPQGTYAWTVPLDATTSAKVRVRDGWDNAPTDSSNATFTIALHSHFLADPDPLELSVTPVGTPIGGEITLHNPGGLALTISSVASDNPRFWTGRTALGIPVSGSDTLGVWFDPAAEGPDSARITFTANDPSSPHVVKVTGQGSSNLAADDRHLSSLIVWQNHPNPFHASTEIRYSLPATEHVSLEVFNLQGQRVARLVQGDQGPGLHAVRFGPGVKGQGDVGSLPSGVYFYRIAAGGRSSTHKMLLMR